MTTQHHRRTDLSRKSLHGKDTQSITLEDGNLIVLVWHFSLIYGNQFIDSQVEKTLFRVWDTSFRRHSPYLDDHDKLGRAAYTWSKDIPDGADDDHPLVLQDTKASDVVCLLWVIYPP